MSEQTLAADAAAARVPGQVVALTRWVGAGRKLTKTGRLTMSDARDLVSLLETGDEIDPVIGQRTFRTRTSEDLRGLTTVLAWAKAAGLVRVVHGRLVSVKKNQRLVDRPLELWTAMFESFEKLAEAICPSGCYTSLFGHDFADGTAALFAALAEGGGEVSIDDTNEWVWSALAARYRLHDATTDQLRQWRMSTDRDLRRAINELIALGALAEDEAGMIRLTPLADWVMRRRFGEVASGERVAQLKVTLRDIEPPVWRRVLVPAKVRLDRLDRVVQAAMGWTNSHLHMFIHHTGRYGVPDWDLPLHDERTATLSDLAGREGDSFGYEYDFGDSWEHDIELEKLVAVEPGGRYPVCVAGERACPPEDCGGTGGYEELIDVLADAGHEGHDDMVRWLGIESGHDFDPARSTSTRRTDGLMPPCVPHHASLDGRSTRLAPKN